MSHHLLIMGATSGIGRLTVDKALSAGLTVRAFARSADSLPDADRLDAFKGDARSVDDVAAALDGVDTVVYALGIKESVAMLWQTVTLFSNTTEILLEQMKLAGVKRLLVVTGFGAGRSQAAMSMIERTGHRAILGRPYADKDRQETLVMESDVDWTIVRPVILTNGLETGTYKVLRDPQTWRNGLISRADVAHYLVTASQSAEDIKRDVVLAR